jgi:hypothetical protein
MEQDYNGWTNRETWATALWINNDQGLYDHAQDLTKEALKCQDGDAVNCLIDALDEFMGELLDMEAVLGAQPEQRQTLVNMSRDIGSFWRVNWREIAESFLSETKLQEASA